VKKLKPEIDSILENVADALIESMKVPKNDQDPFEFYVQRVQSGFFSKEDIFRLNFVKGYHALLSELSKNS